MTFSRVKPSSWSFGEILTSAQMNQLDTDHAAAVDGGAGGDYAPTGTVYWKGKGISVGKALGDDTPFSTANAKWAGAATDLSAGPSIAIQFRDIAAYAEGMLLAVGGTDKIGSSRDDGFSWLDKSANILSAQTIALTCCAGTDSFFIAGGNNAKIYQGVDDTTFLNITLPSSPINIDAMLFDPTSSLFIIGGKTAGAPYLCTLDLAAVPTVRSVPGSITGASQAIAIARSKTGLLVASWDGQTKLAFSSNATTWTASTTSLTSGGYRLAYGDGVFLALNRSGANAYKSTDGDTWTTSGVTAPASTHSSLTCLNGVFIATNGNKIWVSIDQGATWNPVNVQYLAYSTLNRARVVRNRLHVLVTDLTNSVSMRSRRLGFSDGSA